MYPLPWKIIHHSLQFGHKISRQTAQNEVLILGAVSHSAMDNSTCLVWVNHTTNHRNLAFLLFKYDFFPLEEKEN